MTKIGLIYDQTSDIRLMGGLSAAAESQGPVKKKEEKRSPAKLKLRPSDIYVGQLNDNVTYTVQICTIRNCAAM